MKWTKIEHQNFDELKVTLKLCKFLHTMSILSAEHESIMIDDVIKDEFCGYCQSLHSHCECRSNAINYYDEDEIDYHYGRVEDRNESC
jgi:hypothetical protein